MTVQTDNGQDKPSRSTKRKAPFLAPDEFFTFMDVGHPDAVQGVVFAGASGVPNDHLWNLGRAEFGTWAAERTHNRKPAYLTMGSYAPDKVSRFSGRKGDNVVAMGGFLMDIDAGGGHKDAPYDTPREAMEAVVGFIKTAGITPTVSFTRGVAACTCTTA